MTQKKLVMGVSVFLLVVLLLTGYAVLAAELGSKEDPLVTLSYLNDEFTSRIMAQVDAQIAQKTQEFSNKVDQMTADLEADLEAKANEIISGYASITEGSTFVDEVTTAVLARIGDSDVESSTYKKVVVPSGKTLYGGMGTEIVLRLGNATCVSTGSPGLIDLTTGADLAKGGKLEKNHLYIITVESGRGFTATSEATVFIRGSYTIK